MSKEFILFDNDETSFVMKFYRLMDLLVTNKSSSRMESIIFLGIYYIQILSGFYALHLDVLDGDNSNSDLYLNTVTKIIRVKDLLTTSHSAYEIAIYLIIAMMLIITGFFVFLIFKVTKNSFYTLREFLMNFLLKSYIYVAFTPIIDIGLVAFCFEDMNPHFSNVSCNINDNMNIFILSIVMMVYGIFLCFFINLFYNDAYFLSNSYYSRMCCKYEIYMPLNVIIFNVLLSQVRYIGKEIFLIYNLVVSLFFLNFFFEKYLFYDRTTNRIAGLFHILYAWTSIFFLIFAYINMNEKGIVYLIGCLLVIYFYLNLTHKLEEKIILDLPFHKIINKNHLMFYLKSLIDMIHNIESNIEAKAHLIGIIQLHKTECPSPECITKHPEKKIYLPFLEEWSKRDKPEINDKVFLLNFILVMMNFFISQTYYSPEMLINLSLYYLQVIGNYCQAIYYYKKIKEMKLSFQENFSFTRLSFKISKALMAKVKPTSDGSSTLEDMDCSLYYKYEDLSQKFYDEINNDISLSVEFWRSFKTHLETHRPLDFNKIFNLTDKIRLTKNKVEKIWNDLYGIYSGVNDLFTVYENYVEQINDDDMLKRELDAIKNKNLNSADQLQMNYYNLLLNKETGIIIANGDKNKEGLIEKTNEEIDRIFNYKPEELKGMNVSIIQPKIFERHHKSFMQRYYETGEKRIIDRSLKSYGKDKDNALVPLQFVIKLFPVLNDSVFYCGLLVKENLDDIILLDSNFIIQGMCKKLQTKINLDFKHLFQECEIPFYMICKKFINFYKNSLKKKNQKEKSKKNKSNEKTGSMLTQEGNTRNDNLIDLGTNNMDETKPKNSVDASNNNIHEDVEIINENIELEFEIKIPNFLFDYASTMGKRENRSEFRFSKNETAETIDKDIDNTSEYFEENDNLVNDSSRSLKQENEKSKNKKVNFNKQSDEDKEFSTKLSKYRSFFEGNKFYELEEYIEKNNSEKNDSKEYKFIFTFDVYKFGMGQVGYVIRCIDNKQEYEEGSQSDTASDNNIEKLKQIENKKNKLISMKNLNEITEEEKQDLLQIQTEYTKLLLENREFLKLANEYKQDINSTSKVFGFKKEDTAIDDENSSQSSQSSYNNDIANKSRIEEIRSNLLKNVSNFHLLKWIKGIFYLIIIITAAFCAIYLLMFNIVYQDLNNISSLSIGLFQSTIWMSNIISSIISMRTFYQFKLKDSPVFFNSYLPDEKEYFDHLRGLSLDWYDDVMKNFGPIEKKINVYFDYSNNTDILFWKNQEVNYPFKNNSLADVESYPLALSQILANTNQLLKNNFFTINKVMLNTPGYDLHSKQLIEYSSYLSIENAILNLIPVQIQILKVAPNLFQEFNTANSRYIYTILATYTIAIVIFIFMYAFLLYLTNKNMEEGLEKVSKISMDKIDDTLKKIETFDEKWMVKFRHKGNTIKLSNDDIKGDSKHENSHIHSKDKFQGFSVGRKYKSLKILTPSYIQIPILLSILIAILIPIYFVSVSMIEACNNILYVHNFIFGKALTASMSSVYIKCMMSECPLGENVDYLTDFVNKTQIENIVKNIGEFPELSNFYSNKFLLNACEVIYDSELNSTEYQNCMNDFVIKSANNTDSLLKLIDETVSTIIKDKEMKTGKKYVLKNGNEEEFSNVFLYETEYFNKLEYVFYNYITPVSDRFSQVVSSSLGDYMSVENTIIVILICLFGFIIFLFSFYIAFCFTKNLIHLLSVARCILKIIPTGVINNTPELKTWIENKY